MPWLWLFYKTGCISLTNSQLLLIIIVLTNAWWPTRNICYPCKPGIKSSITFPFIINTFTSLQLHLSNCGVMLRNSDKNTWKNHRKIQVLEGTLSELFNIPSPCTLSLCLKKTTMQFRTVKELSFDRQWDLDSECNEMGSRYWLFLWILANHSVQF